METQVKNPHKGKVHRVLAHSYLVYLGLFLIGVCLDFIFKIKILGDVVMIPIGFVFLILASALIIWAQIAGNKFGKLSEVKKEHFYKGPYKYTRMPTQWGLFFLMLGFGIVINAFFVILSTVLSFFISKFFFMNKHDKMLVEKYGDAYVEYKRLIRFKI